MDLIKEIAGPLTVIVAIFLLLICGVRGCEVAFVENVPTTCYVDGQMVYQGSSAGITVESSGYATKVMIKGGFLYFFPKAYYVSKDVRLEGVK